LFGSRTDSGNTSPCGHLKKRSPPNPARFDGEVFRKDNKMYNQDSAVVKIDTIAKHKKRNAAWRGKLGRLTEHRYHNHCLPDDAKGRAMLVAFLRCRLSADDAKERAPWITDSELKELQGVASEMTDIKQLGKLIGLTWAERMACRVFFLPACNVTPLEASRLQAERNRENGNKRQIKFRESKMTTRHTAKRDDAVLRMLATLPKPLLVSVPVSALVKEAKKCDAFRRPDGLKLTPGSLRKTVHRVLKTLKANGLIEMTERPGARGMVTMVRLVELETVRKKMLSVTDFDTVTTCPQENDQKHLHHNGLRRFKPCNAVNTSSRDNQEAADQERKHEDTFPTLVWSIPTPEQTAHLTELRHSYACVAMAA
jgi:hypothetical protein